MIVWSVVVKWNIYMGIMVTTENRSRYRDLPAGCGCVFYCFYTLIRNMKWEIRTSFINSYCSFFLLLSYVPEKTHGSTLQPKTWFHVSSQRSLRIVEHVTIHRWKRQTVFQNLNILVKTSIHFCFTFLFFDHTLFRSIKTIWFDFYFNSLHFL